jgi:cycloeucalenol cycloisomerase
MSSPLAAHAGKRWSERFVLLYSPVWIAAVALLTVTRAFARFGDPGHLAMGVALAAPIALMPRLSPERDRPFAARHATRFALWIWLFSFLQCYFGSWLFFDVLGMEYHFPVHWIWNETPLFLDFMTVAYFATYYVAMSLVWRRFLRAWPAAPTVARALVLVALGFAVAFAETGSMANPLLQQYFQYRNKAFALSWGSLFYGTVFVASLPFVFALDEPPRDPPPPLGRVILDVLAANMIVLVAYQLYGFVARR